MGHPTRWKLRIFPNLFRSGPGEKIAVFARTERLKIGE